MAAFGAPPEPSGRPAFLFRSFRVGSAGEEGSSEVSVWRRKSSRLRVGGTRGGRAAFARFAWGSGGAGIAVVADWREEEGRLEGEEEEEEE